MLKQKVNMELKGLFYSPLFLAFMYIIDASTFSDIPTKVGVIFLQSKSDIETLQFQ